MNPPTDPVSNRDVHQTHQQMRRFGGLSASARENVLERVRAARKRLPKTPPGLARLR